MVKFTLVDEILCNVSGLPVKKFQKLKEAFKLPVPGAHMSADFQLKRWDGKESIVDDGGFTYSLYADEVLDVIQQLGYEEDEIEFADERKEIPELPREPIDIDYVVNETGYQLREPQLRSINTAITHRTGVLDAATNLGKTVVCLAISKYYQDYLPSIIIVPNQKLVRATFNDYKNGGLDVYMIPDKEKSNDNRIEGILAHRHAVITYKMYCNLIDYEYDQQNFRLTGRQSVLMYDEVHIMGDVTMSVLKDSAYNCPVRIGMSGTVNDEPLKSAKIFGIMGGEVLESVTVKELQNNGYASSVDIHMMEVEHPEINELCSHDAVKSGNWDWNIEERYYANPERVALIADLINTYGRTDNTLVLCAPQVGNQLSEMMGIPYIDKDASTDLRDELFSQFRELDDYMLLASYGTSATGISENRIFTLFLIDVGENKTRIKQSIGRLIRLDGVVNHGVVYDVYSNTYYGQKHMKGRKKIYAKEKQTILNERKFIVGG